MKKEPTNHLIDIIYDAAVNPNRWQDVVDGLTARVPGIISSINKHYFGAEIEAHLISSGYEQYYKDQYKKHYKNVNPLLDVLRKQKISQSVAETNLIHTSQYSDTEFYDGFLKPQSIEQVITVKLQSTDKTLINFFTAIKKDRDGNTATEALKQVQYYLPHISRAVKISRLISNFRVDAFDLENTINKLAVAAFIINGAHAVTFANLAAQKMMTISSGLQLDDQNHLRASLNRSDERLQAAINFALSHSTPFPPVNIHRPENKQSLTAIAFRNHQESRFQSKFDKIFSDREASICLFVFDPVERPIVPEDILASAFNLTPAQTRLALALSQGEMLKDYADRVEISRNTARNHLAATMEKMGITRQSELVSLVAQLSVVVPSAK